MVFDDAAPDWSSWTTPWFTDNRIPDENWSSFAANKKNQLIITLNLFPTPLADTDWRAIGADGGYTAYARSLATNLVNDHMGHAIIRLAHEANGTWYPDNIGTTPAEWAQWTEFWRHTVFAMRSVPGAHFTFNWCIAAGAGTVPFADYYPGNDVVDSIGVDVYDSGIPAGTTNRWSYVYNMRGGVAAIARFAKRNHKPLTIPEWGLVPVANDGGGDDPAFVKGLAKFVRTDDIAFQSYFFADNSAAAIDVSPESLSIYRSAFGPDSQPPS